MQNYFSYFQDVLRDICVKWGVLLLGRQKHEVLRGFFTKHFRHRRKSCSTIYQNFKISTSIQIDALSQ